MEQVIGRAGFHAEHAKRVSERGAILHEMMRELDDSSIEYWAARNPNIVVADEPLNEAMVNDGSGGFRPCTDRQEVLDYGAGRVRRVKRKFSEDRYNPRTKKMQGGTVTTTLVVAHLPKSMCIEVPNFYPVIDHNTGAPVLDVHGEPKMRSRWVAGDRNEARQYFEDVLGHLTDVAIPGGVDGVLGYDVQHSESTPHIQILADTFAPDPKDEDALRVETSRYWFSHRDVKDENGKQKTGRTKMREYHAGLKEHLIDVGYDISPDFDEARHMVGMGKEEYGRAMDAQQDAQERAVAVRTRETIVAAAEKDLARAHEEHAADKDRLSMAQAKLDEDQQRLRAREGALDERQGILDRREAEMPLRRRRAVAEGRKEGREQAICDAEATVSSWLEAYAERFREQEPAIFSDFLDRVHSKGRTLRPLFEQYVDARLKQFEVEHNVVDILDLEPGDRERYIQDGGAQLAAEVEQLQRDRQVGS